MPRHKSATTYSFRPEGATADKVQIVSTGIVIAKDTGHGIKVDPSAPTWGWKDLIGNIVPKASGVGAPTRTAYRGNIFDYAFIANDIADLNFHIPHDYAPGTDMYAHVHWSHNGTDISGNAGFTFYYAYQKGHNQGNFPADSNVVITYNTTNIATTPQYRHRVDEVQLSTSGQLGGVDIEVDGLILGAIKLTTLPTITGGSLFIHTVDIHYQSTQVATKNKAPNFYT